MSSGRPLFRPGTLLFRAQGVRYHLERDLGPGPHGERVLLASRQGRDGEPQGPLVLKYLWLRARDEATREARQRLEEEVRLATWLRHPHIARVEGLHQERGALYVMMEAVPGHSLDSLLTLAQERGRYFSEAFMLAVGTQVASALAYAHSRTDEEGVPLRIVHRGVDPTRIRVTLQGRAKLTDFGLASARLPGRQSVRVPRARGDAYYTSPEALFGGSEDGRSDLFALGLVLLEFATGRHLLNAQDLLARELWERVAEARRERVARAITRVKEEWAEPGAEELVLRAATFTPEDVERAAGPLSEPVRALLGRLLRREPDERPQAAVDAEVQLRKLLREREARGSARVARELREALLEAGEALVDARQGVTGGLTPDDITTEPMPA